MISAPCGGSISQKELDVRIYAVGRIRYESKRQPIEGVEVDVGAWPKSRDGGPRFLRAQRISNCANCRFRHRRFLESGGAHFSESPSSEMLCLIEDDEHNWYEQGESAARRSQLRPPRSLCTGSRGERVEGQ